MRRILILGIMMAMAIPACSSGSTDTTQAQASETTTAAGGAQIVKVELADVDSQTEALTPTPGSVPAGEVTFEVTNSGDKEHEFVVFKTDLAIEDLPTNESGSEVIEDGPGLEAIDEIEGIAPGETKTLTVTLEAGNYALICNIKGHYQRGMRSAFTVS